MARVHHASKSDPLPPTESGDVMTKAAVTQQIADALAGFNPGGSSGAGKIALSALWRPMEGVHPAANAAGPIVTNVGLTTAAPTLTNMVFIPWNSVDAFGRSRFNRQSQNWVAAPAAYNPSQSTCVNVPNEKINGYVPGAGINPGNMDVNFVTNSKRCVLQMQGFQFITNTSAFDMQTFIEDGGTMQRTQRLPETYTVPSNTVPVYKDVTMTRNRGVREWRYFLPPSAGLQGVWVEQGCVVYAAPNKPLIVLDGNSWVDPFTYGGNGSAEDLGSFYTLNLGFGLAMRTGAHVIQQGQGGTAYFNALNGATTDRNTYRDTGTKVSTFMSVMRNAFYRANFQSHKPLFYMCEGSANDGALPPAPARASMTTRVLACVDDLLSTDPTLPIILTGPQSYLDPTPGSGDATDLNRLGIKDACAARPNNLQFFDQSDYTDGTGQGGSPATSQWAWINYDGLHPNAGGVEYITQRWADDLGRRTVSLDRLNACMAVEL